MTGPDVTTLQKSCYKFFLITSDKDSFYYSKNSLAGKQSMDVLFCHKTVELSDNAATRGQIQQIGYMLKVEEI